MDHLEARRRVAQQPMRARDVARGQHEAIAALLQRLQQLALHVAQAREALERPQLEHFVEQERRRPIAAPGRARNAPACDRTPRAPTARRLVATVDARTASWP